MLICVLIVAMLDVMSLENVASVAFFATVQRGEVSNYSGHGRPAENGRNVWISAEYGWFNEGS